MPVARAARQGEQLKPPEIGPPGAISSLDGRRHGVVPQSSGSVQPGSYVFIVVGRDGPMTMSVSNESTSSVSMFSVSWRMRGPPAEEDEDRRGSHRARVQAILLFRRSKSRRTNEAPGDWFSGG